MEIKIPFWLENNRSNKTNRSLINSGIAVAIYSQCSGASILLWFLLIFNIIYYAALGIFGELDCIVRLVVIVKFEAKLDRVLFGLAKYVFRRWSFENVACELNVSAFFDSSWVYNVE